MSGMTNWRSHKLTQQQLLAQQQLVQQQLAQQQQLEQLQQAEMHQAEMHQAEMQQAEMRQAEMQAKHTAQTINISHSTVTINGPTQITSDKVTVTGGNNQIINNGPTGIDTPILKDIIYSINNNMPAGPLGTCVVAWNGTGNRFNGIINPDSYITGSTTFINSDTLTMTFTDLNNPGWTYKGTFTYSNTGNPTASFQSSIAGYTPISMTITIPNVGVKTTIKPDTNGTIYQLYNNNIPDGSSWNITFNPIDIKPISLQTKINNATPYDLTFNNVLITAATSINLPVINKIEYDVNSPITNAFNFNWAGTTDPIQSGGVFTFNAAPAPSAPSISINMGTETSLFNYVDIQLIVNLIDLNSNKTIKSSSILIPGSGVYSLFSFSEMQTYINTNAGSTLVVDFEFKAIQQLPLVTNFVFNNNTPYAVTITPGDCTTSDPNPIPAGGTATWIETIQSNDNYITPAIPHQIKWVATGNANNYSGTCTTTLNTSNSGQGIVCLLTNVTGSGITTDLTFNNKPIVADIYGTIAVPQSSIPLPPTTPNTYAITLTAGPLVDCIYNLIVNNNTIQNIVYNGTSIIKGTPFNTAITVSNGQTQPTSLNWTFPDVSPYLWGGPSTITVICESDGTGNVASIDRGSFNSAYQPIMVATVSGNNTPFTQTGSQGASPYNTFPNNIPATGGSITLTFTD